MKSVNNILVGLDLSESDEKVLNYVKNLNLMLRPEKIIFVNIHKEIELPIEVVEDFPEVKESVTSNFIKEMVEEASEFNMFGADHEYLALEGNPLTQILKIAADKKVDLLVVGKKSNRDSHGITHKKLIRKAPCDVLIVPDARPASFDKILIPVDYSDHSMTALMRATELAAVSRADLIVQNVYEVPNGYSKTGKSYMEFAAIMKGHAQNHYAEFVKNAYFGKVKVQPIFTLNQHKEIAVNVLETAKEMGADLIICGAKGKSNLSAMLLGSFTESLIEADDEMPAMIIKKLASEFGFWETIKAI